jgi:hypothetical protein
MANREMFGQAAKYSLTIQFLVQIFGDPTYEQKYADSSRDDAFEFVRSVLSHSTAAELMPIPKVMNALGSETRVVIESIWVNFASHAVKVYKKFGRRLHIDLRWYEGPVSDATFLRKRFNLPVFHETGHLIELVFSRVSKLKPKSETNEADM